jgi:DNA replication protein DnaC
MPEISPTTAPSGEICTAHREPLPCPVCEVLKAEARQAREVRSLAGLKDIQIGKRYREATFDDYKPVNREAERVKAVCQRYAETFSSRLEGGDSLLLLGAPGTGKNMLAACICKEIVGQGYTALHTTAMKLVRKIKTSWGKFDLDEQEMIDQFARPDLLVVDEIGVQFGSVTEKILQFEAINGRYEERRPTILISNLAVAEVETYLGATLIDRFYEGKSAVLVFDWDSYRRRA